MVRFNRHFSNTKYPIPFKGTNGALNRPEASSDGERRLPRSLANLLEVVQLYTIPGQLNSVGLCHREAKLAVRRDSKGVRIGVLTCMK